MTTETKTLESESEQEVRAQESKAEGADSAETEEEARDKEPTIEELVAQTTESESGLKYPEGVSEEQKLAIKYAKEAEKARTDALSNKAQAEALKGTVAELRGYLDGNLEHLLTDEERAELNKLRGEDADDYHARKTEIIEARRAEVQGILDKAEENSEKVAKEIEREAVLAQFYKDNPGFELDGDDVPQNTWNVYEKGEITFKELLEQTLIVKKALGKGKVGTGNKDSIRDVDMDKVGGVGGGDDNHPEDHKPGSTQTDYTKGIY